MDGRAPFDWPLVDVIVATHNEERLIAGKLRELEAMTYPADRVRFAVVDGGSTDTTVAAITSHALLNPRLQTVLTAVPSKPAQLNEALARTHAPWVLVTDADARVPPDTLRQLVETAAADPSVGVVGTTVVPHDPHPLDAWHWRISNWIRSAERRVGGATGLAVAPCYLFRRDLIERFPADTVADDVYAVHRAAHQGARTVLVESDVTELRVAGSTFGWFRHKVRRTLGYLREVFRFGPSLLGMPAPMRSFLLWRAAALTMMPAAGLAAGLLLAWALGPWLAATALLLALAASGLRPPLTAPGGLRNAILGTTVPLWFLVITLSALALYPFVRQGGPYSRWTLKAEEPEACS